jgi:hypothetical protein
MRRSIVWVAPVLAAIAFAGCGESSGLDTGIPPGATGGQAPKMPEGTNVDTKNTKAKGSAAPAMPPSGASKR